MVCRLELKESQEKVKEYFEKNNVKPWTQFAILARLEEEISEIGRIISVDEGLREEWKIDNMDRVDEFGDALFQLMHLANQMDVDLEEAMEKVLKKYSEYVKDK